jgi:hypothetical protein
MSASKKSVLRRDTTNAHPPDRIVGWLQVKVDDYDPPLVACPDKTPPFPPDLLERAMRRTDQLTRRQSPPPIPAGTSLDAVSVDESTSEEEDRDDVDPSTTPAPEDALTPTQEQTTSTDSGERGSAVRLCQIPREQIFNFCTTGFSLQFEARL